MTEKPKPEVQKVLDEFARELNCETFTELRRTTRFCGVEIVADKYQRLATLAYEQGKLEQAFLAKKTLEKKPETTGLIDILESDWHTLKEKNPKIAREMLKHYVDMWNIPVSGYGNDEVIEMIWDGRLSGINANGYWFASYEQQKPYYVASRLKSQLSKNADEEANIEAYKQAENDEASRGSEEK